MNRKTSGKFGIFVLLFCKRNQPNLSMLFVLLFTLITSIRSTTSYATTGDKERCEEITVPLCKGVGYNYTMKLFENDLNHSNQEEAGLEVHQFWPLVEIQCSDDLKFFLCSIYTPICIEDYHGRLPACRSVCERARSGCAPIMRQYGFAWPERMNCEDLPVFGDQEHLCMDSKEGAAPSSGDPYKQNQASKGPVKETNKEPKSRTPFKNSKPYKGKERERLGSSVSKIPPPGVVGFGSAECRCECRAPMIMITDMMDRRYYNRVETGGIVNCGQPCNTVYFTKAEQSDAVFWITSLAIACCICTSITLLTFMTDTERFRYPERSIIFLSGCYLMVSIGFIIRSHVGHNPIACDGQMIRYQGTGPGPTFCVVIFLLVYFFGMASSVWWVILTLTWFLTAGLKWGNEAIAGYSQYFHLLAWFIPTVKSVIVLAVGAVDGDPFTGICYVGNLDLINLRNFVIIPLAIYISLGMLFLLAGIISLLRIRKLIREQAGAKADKLEKLMIRISIYSLLYMVPSGITFGCYFYELKYREIWEKHFNCPCSVPPQKPLYSIFLLKYLACLVVGITSGFWIWSGKTIESWYRFYSRLCCGSTSSSSTRSGASHLIPGSNNIVNNQRTYKQIPTHQAFSSTSHIAHIPPPGSHCKQLPLSHV